MSVGENHSLLRQFLKMRSGNLGFGIQDFEIAIAKVIGVQNSGYDIVWKDWDESYDKPNELQSHPKLINAMNGNQKFTLAS